MQLYVVILFRLGIVTRLIRRHDLIAVRLDVLVLGAGDIALLFRHGYSFRLDHLQVVKQDGVPGDFLPSIFPFVARIAIFAP